MSRKKEKQKTIGKKYKEKPCFLEYLSNMNQIYHPPLNNYGTRHNIWNNVLQTMDFRKNGILVPVTNEIMRWVLSLSQFTAWRHFLCHSSERRILKESSHIAEKRRQRTEFRDFTAAITCRTQQWSKLWRSADEFYLPESLIYLFIRRNYPKVGKELLKSRDMTTGNSKRSLIIRKSLCYHELEWKDIIISGEFYRFLKWDIICILRLN